MLRGCISNYKIPKMVLVHSTPFTLICRLIHLLVLLYGILYLIIHRRGYQMHDESIISSTTLDVKGVNYNPIEQNQRIMIDDADYIAPSREEDALFVMTNSIQTVQEYKRCSESFDVREATCVNDTQCQLSKNMIKGNGRWTGRCLKQPARCELEGWCPVLNDRFIPKPSYDTLNFTLFIKNYIEFPRFQVLRRNTHASPYYLKRCNYHPVIDKTCPIFRIGTLLDIVEPDPNEQRQMLESGAVIRIKIDWACNLDQSLDRCLPQYSFERLTPRFKEESFSGGFNFRFASHWKCQNQSLRTVTRAFGLYFMISVQGYAGRFDLTVLMINIVMIIAVVCLVTFIFDSIGLHIYSRSNVDQPQEYQGVEGLTRKNEQARLAE